MIFTEYPNDFWHKRNFYNFDPYNVFLVIATNIPQRLKTGFGSRVTNVITLCSYLLSQCPKSGRCAHCTPVWFSDLSRRQQVKVSSGVASASHFSEPGLIPSSAAGENDGPSLALEGSKGPSSFSSSRCLCSLKYFLQTSWKMARHSVLSRKYQIWCSSSMKLLEAKLRV